MEDRKEKYGPTPEDEKKSVVISFRLTPADAAALEGTGGPADASLNEIARLRALEAIAAQEDRELKHA